MLWDPNLPKNLHFVEFGGLWTVPMRPTKKMQNARIKQNAQSKLMLNLAYTKNWLVSWSNDKEYRY